MRWDRLPDEPELPRPKVIPEEIGWVGDDGKTVEIECQGNFAAVSIRKRPCKTDPKLRGKIKGFSAGSRLRMFKIINRIDLTPRGRSTFATFTWRDDLGRPEKGRLTLARSQCQRSLERAAGQQWPGIWRIEWKERKTGIFAGEYMPHIHVIYFSVGFLPIAAWSSSWSTAIGWHGRVSVKVVEIRDIRRCMYYVSKYVAKPDGLCNLDIPSYLSTHVGGRMWGLYRKNLLPFAEHRRIRVSPGQLSDDVRKAARDHRPQTPEYDQAGFCIFGSGARKIGEIVDNWCGKQADS